MTVHATATRARAPAPPPLLLALPEMVHRLAEEEPGSEPRRGFSYASIPVHAEPDVSRPSDAAEREAEAVAERVAAGLSARAGAGGTSAAADGAAVLASRPGGPCRAPDGFRAALASGAPGTTVPQPARARLESAFGRSFAGVRLHRDARADTLSRAIGARAFTWGSAIHLSASAPAADTAAGLRLLAHELTHVVQGTGRGEVRRAEALYFSTQGQQPYYEAAKRFHAAHGFPAAVEVSSVEEMLEHLVGLPAGLTRVRLVTHAVPSGIFLPLLRGGSASLFQADLRLQSQGRLEGELATEHATVGRDNREITVEHHVVPQHWAGRLYQRLSSDPTWTRFRTASGLPATLAPGGDLETYLWWVLDRAMLTTQEPAGQDRRGTPQMRHVLGLPTSARAAKIASLDRTIAIYAALARAHLIARTPTRLARAQRERRADQALADLRSRVDGTAPDLVRSTVQAGGFQPGRVSGPTPRYGTVQGALERGTYANNLLMVKSRLPHGVPFEIRGCRIGQNAPWLASFRDFWGLGVGGPPDGRRPHVTAPDLRHFFGVRPVGRGRQRRRVTAEWLEGPRGRQIQGGTPEFDQHIVHAR